MIREIKTHSQAGQDWFALYCNNFNNRGYFVDLGCNTFRDGNNTFLLETEFNWRGILVDYVPALVQECNENRSNPAIRADLTTRSVTSILDEYDAPHLLSYVSLDLDGEESRIICLKNIDPEKYKMRCLTFETDAYTFGDNMRNQARDYLSNLGYELICGDVHYTGLRFEDWYVLPELVDMELMKKLKCDGLEYTEILQRMI